MGYGMDRFERYLPSGGAVLSSGESHRGGKLPGSTESLDTPVQAVDSVSTDILRKAYSLFRLAGGTPPLLKISMPKKIVNVADALEEIAQILRKSAPDTKVMIDRRSPSKRRRHREILKGLALEAQDEGRGPLSTSGPMPAMTGTMEYTMPEFPEISEKTWAALNKMALEDVTYRDPYMHSL